MSSTHSHGIGLYKNLQVDISKSSKFDGSIPGNLPALLRTVAASLHQRGLDMPPEGITEANWLNVNQLGFTKGPGERNVLTAAQITGAHTEMGFVTGDYDLTFEHRRLYNKEVEAAGIMKRKSIAVFKGEIESGSSADLIITPAYEEGSFIAMRAALESHYRPQTLSAIYHQEYNVLVQITANPSKGDAMTIHREATRATHEFEVATDCHIQGTRTLTDYMTHKVRMQYVRTWCNKLAIVRSRASNPEVIEKFLSNHVFTCLEPLGSVNLVNLDQILTHLVSLDNQTKFKGKVEKEVSTEALVIKLNALEKANVALQKRKQQSNGPQLQKKVKKVRKDRGKGPCSHCNHIGHSVDFCWLKEGADHTGRPPNWKPHKFKVSTLELSFTEVDEPSLNVVEVNASSGSTSGEHRRYADSCASHTVFNKYAKQLFLSLTRCQSQSISGIGGGISMSVEAEGEVVFMGTIVPAYYAPNISKSVMSESALCRFINFSISRTNQFE